MRGTLAIGLVALGTLCGACSNDDLSITLVAVPGVRPGTELKVRVADGNGSTAERFYDYQDFPRTLTISAEGRQGPFSVHAEVFTQVLDTSAAAMKPGEAAPWLTKVLGQGSTSLNLGESAELLLVPNDFLANADVAGSQELGEAFFGGRQLAVASDASFMVAWQDVSTAKLRLFGADSLPKDNALEHNSREFALSESYEFSGFVSVAFAEAGYLAVWEYRPYSEFDSIELQGRRFGVGDASADLPFVISSPSAGQLERMPTVAALTGGGYVVAWLRVPEGEFDDALAEGDVRYLVLDAEGQPQVASVALTAAGAYGSLRPEVSARRGGGFTLTWAERENVVLHVYSQNFSATGASESDKIKVADSVPGYPQAHSTALPGSSGIAVVWFHGDEIADYLALRTFTDASLGQQSGEIRVAEIGDSTHQLSGCAVAAGGTDERIAVVWSVASGDENESEIYLRYYDADGNALSEATVVNTTSSGLQNNPSIEAYGEEGFLIGWTDSSATPPDVDGLGVRVRIVYPELLP